MPTYIHYGPVETPEQLANFRDRLIGFIETACPPGELIEHGVMLCAEHLLRFMRDCQERDKTQRELQQGLHASQLELQEYVLEARGNAAKYTWLAKALTELPVEDSAEILQTLLDSVKSPKRLSRLALDLALDMAVATDSVKLRGGRT